MPSHRAWIAIILLFIGLIVWRLPAQWLVGALPAQVRCDAPVGTVWAGQCPQLTAMGVVFQQVSWQLDPAQLLRVRLGGSLRIDDPRLQGQTGWSFGRAGELQLSGLNAQLALPNTLLPAFPTGWSGRLQLQFDRARYQHSRIVDLRGHVQLLELRQQQPAAEMGGYELTFAPGAASGDRVNGSVRDLGGPVTLTGSLRLRAPNAYEFDGKVAASSSAGETLRRLIEQLGPVDAQGLRVVSVAGTL